MESDEMPFDGIADPVAAKSLQALELMEDRLQGGRKWTRHFIRNMMLYETFESDVPFPTLGPPFGDDCQPEVARPEPGKIVSLKTVRSGGSAWADSRAHKAVVPFCNADLATVFWN